jgi:hypothetical protein
MPHASSSLPGTHASPLQHPLGHDCGPHRHVAPSQYWSGAHCGLAPQRHSPATHTLASAGSQKVHTVPPEPHASVVPPAWHTFASQQPVGHDVPSHTQALEVLQRCPAAHAAPAPHPHWPDARHVLLVVVEQFWHALPLTPQLPVVLGLTHAPPMQHPAGHDVASHTQVPPAQRWPTAQGSDVPHLHWPLVQRLARVASHVVQALPLVPHCESDGVVQVDPLQHPLMQLAALQPWQACPTQLCPLHEAHVAPPAPHTVLLVPG